MQKQNTKFLIIVSLVFFIILAAFIINSREKSIRITKEKYSNEWAFSVDTLYLKCSKGMVTAADTNGQLYYLNGIAADKYSKNSNYKNISSIQIEDEKMNNMLKKLSNGQTFTPVKKSVDFAINKGLELCK